MYGYIYLTENLVNGKKYIGKHKADSFDNSYFGSGKILTEAIEKYGIENFSCKILDSINNIPTVCDTLEQLNNSEIYYIDYYNCKEDENYYNLKSGGDGGWDFKAWSGENNGMYGVHRFGADNPNYGNTWDQEARDRMSQTIKNNGGRKGQNKGIKFTEEHKQHLREAKLDENGNYKYSGEKAVHYGKHETHPCFGLRWWCDGIHKPIKSKTCPGPQYHLGRK